MRQLQNDLGQGAEMYRLSHLAGGVLGANLEGAMAVALDRVDQVDPFVQTLEARRAAAPEDAKPFEAVHSILDFVPRDQDKKLPLLLELRDKLERAHARGFDHATPTGSELSPDLAPGGPAPVRHRRPAARIWRGRSPRRAAFEAGSSSSSPRPARATRTCATCCAGPIRSARRSCRTATSSAAPGGPSSSPTCSSRWCTTSPGASGSRWA